jgi:hypothetical protein
MSFSVTNISEPTEFSFRNASRDCLVVENGRPDMITLNFLGAVSLTDDSTAADFEDFSGQSNGLF